MRERSSHPVIRRAAAAAAEALERRVLLAVTPAGPEFRVNTSPNASQSAASVASDADGDFVVAWHSFGQDGDGFGVFARVYNASGGSRTADLPVNTTTAGAQLQAAVAMDADGDFVVAWQGPDGAGDGVWARRYTAAGAPKGGEFLVNTSTAGSQQSPSVAMDAAGNFVVAWQATATLTPGESPDIKAQRFDSAGNRAGGEIAVNVATAGPQNFTDVAMDARGGFVVAWQSQAVGGGAAGVFARRFDAAGAAAGGDIPVDPADSGVFGALPAVAADRDGDFVVAWQFVDASFNADIFARRFNAAGVAQGSAIPVNLGTAGSQTSPDVTMDADGDFVIAWASRLGSYALYHRRFNAAGAAQGGDEQVNTTTTGPRYEPSVAADAEGDFVIAWHGTGADPDAGLLARRYDESTDTAGPFVTDVVAGGAPIAPDGHADGPLSSVVLVFSENVALNGGVGPQPVVDPASYTVARVGGGAAPQVASVGYRLNVNRWEATLTFAAPLGKGRYTLTARQSLRDAAGNTLDGNLDGAPGGDQLVSTFSVDLPGTPVGGEVNINAATAGSQSFADVAADADGDFVAVWTSLGHSGGDGFDVFGQRFDAAGQKRGGEFLVNTVTAGTQFDVSAAMDADGDFVVTWTGYTSATPPTRDVYAQRFNSSGQKLGGEFRVNTTAASDQTDAEVAMDAEGDFLVAWLSKGQDAGGSYGVYAQAFDSDGVRRGGEFRVHTATADDQVLPAVAADARGRFVVAWASSTADGVGIFARRFDADGAALTADVPVNQTGAVLSPVGLACDADGDFVVTWIDPSGAGQIQARRFLASGAPQGGEFQVNTFTQGFKYGPRPAMDADGDFVVTWENSALDSDPTGVSFGVAARRYDRDGAAQSAAEFRVNTTTIGQQRNPSAATDADGDIVVAFDNGGDVFFQRYEVAGDDAPIFVTETVIAEDPVQPGERMAGVVSSITLTFSEESTSAGGSGGAHAAANPANYRLSRNGVDLGQAGLVFPSFDAAAGKHGVTIFPFTGTLGNGAYVLTVRQDVQDVAGNALDGNLDGVPGGDYTLAFTVDVPVAVGPEQSANSVRDARQTNTAAAMNDNGDYVLVWERFDSGGSGSVLAQRYSAGGVARGGEIVVGPFGSDPQDDAAVAMETDGDFVVAWTSVDSGSGFGVYARRFSAAGVPRGGEFLVNTTTVLNQDHPSVATDDNGNFIIVWQSTQGLDRDIYGRRYNAAGAALGGEFLVNGATGNGQQTEPAAAMDPGGDLVVAWTSEGQDGSGKGVYARQFGATGTAGAEFRVNATTEGDQSTPSAATDAEGNFVIAWQGVGQDAQRTQDIFARRYDAAGRSRGTGEFRVNSTTADRQSAPTVAADRDGDFVIAWQSQIQDGQFDGIYAQRHDAAGAAQGGEFRVNTTTAGDQTNAAAAMDADGDFVIAWASDAIFGTQRYNVFAQRYNTNAAPTVLALGPEFPVNLTTANGQESPAIASDADADFVVVWQSYGQDGSETGVYGQRYNAAGVPQGAEFLVNGTTAGSQFLPAVAMDADGDFVVAWISTSQDTDGSRGVFARRFNAAGVPQGGEFRLSSTIAGEQFGPSLAMAPGGDFIAAWADGPLGNGDVYARRFTAVGVPVGGEFLVNTQTAGNQSFPETGVAADGRFVIAWQSAGQDPDGSSGIYAKRYTAAGAEQAPAASVPRGDGNEFRVNATASGLQSTPAVGMDAAGEFVVAWEGFPADPNFDIYAQRFDAAGAPLGGELLVNSSTDDNQRFAALAMDADGDFVVAWGDKRLEGGAFNYGVYAQRYDAAGGRQGAQFHVNTFTAGHQFQPAVATDADGDFVVAWASEGQDGSGRGIYGQRYDAPFPSVRVAQDAPDSFISLWAVFDDSTDPDPLLTFSILGDTNPSLFSSTTISSQNGLLTLDYAPARTGTAAITVRATDTGGLFTDTVFNVTVTPGPLLVTGSEFVFQSPPHRLKVTFNRGLDPSTLQPQDLSVQPLAGGPSFPATAVTYDAPTRTATFTLVTAPERFLANGNYRATLAAGAVADTFGIPVSAAGPFDFFALAGDFNRDRVVNTDDFIALANNFARTGRTYAQGDADGNGTVDTSDFIILASNFARSVPAPPAAIVARAVVASTPSSGVQTLPPAGRRRRGAARAAAGTGHNRNLGIL